MFIDEVFNKPEDKAPTDQSEGNTGNQCDDKGFNYNKFTGLKRLELRGNSGRAFFMMGTLVI